jgi:hypothetical protein
MLTRAEVIAKEGTELTSRLLRTAALVREPYKAARAVLNAALRTGVPAAVVGTEIGMSRPKLAGRSGYPIEFYLEIAVRYTQLIDQDGDPHPTATIARERGWNERYGADKISRARALGLLTPPPRPGVAGGELTDKARALLAER